MTAAANSDLPFARYEGGGRRLLGRPRQGDLTPRHGYGPPVFEQCGFTCAYCGMDMSAPYENWLQLSVDHVVPSGARSSGYPPAWLEDVTNLVTCCRPCNEFSNAFVVAEPAPREVEAFFLLRDRAFIAKRALLRTKHEKERQWYQDHVVALQEPTGPDLPAEPTP
jgi:hypothetical protein